VVPIVNVPEAGRRRLMARRELDMEYLRAYYGCHNADPNFRSDLEKLVKLKPADLAKLKPADQKRAVEEFERAVEEFVARWALPPGEGRLDVLYTVTRIQQARARPERPRPVRLVLRPRAIPTRVTVDGVDLVLDGAVPMELDLPLRGTQAALRRHLLRAAGLLSRRGASRVAKAAGAQRLPTQHRRPGELDRIAERLYNHAVRGWSWEKISEEGGGPELHAVRESVYKMADRVGVALPRTRAGRPRSK
jgi:hypothetical protein